MLRAERETANIRWRRDADRRKPKCGRVRRPSPTGEAARRQKFKRTRVLPVAASATATTAASAATAAATTTTAIAAASATTAAATASAATTTAAFALRAGFIDYDLAAFEIFSVESGNGFFSFPVVTDLDETESARLSRETIADQCN